MNITHNDIGSYKDEPGGFFLSGAKAACAIIDVT